MIVAFVLFMVIKGMNQLRRKQEEEPASEPPPSQEVQLLQQIRDALVSGRSGPGAGRRARHRRGRGAARILRGAAWVRCRHCA